MTITDFVILGVACHRLTGMWFEEIAAPARRWLMRRQNRLAYLSQCPVCLSVWAGGAVLGVWHTPLWPLVAVIALSGAAIVLGQIVSIGTGSQQIAREVSALRTSIDKLTIEAVDNGKP